MRALAPAPLAPAPPAGQPAKALTRRDVLKGAGLAAALLAPGRAALAFAWDGKSSALGSCAIGDEGAECRAAYLRRDKATGKTEDYSAITRARPQENTVGIPVAEMRDAYSKETAALGDLVVKYAGLDAYDPQRPAVVQELRKDAAVWVSKYARGGSARKVSARRFYIAVDALQGHLASNGLAPFPKAKLTVLLSNVQQAQMLIAQNK